MKRSPTQSWIRFQQTIALFGAVLISSQTGLAGNVDVPAIVSKPHLSSQEFYDIAVKESKGKEWEKLFNGKDLQGWKVVLANAAPGEDPEKIFQVVNGEIHVYRDTPAGKNMPFGVILTDKDYSHYRFRFEYKWGEKKFAPRANTIRDAGLLYHTIGAEKIWPVSVECQVQENDTGDFYFVYTGGDCPVDQAGTKFLDPTLGGKFKTIYQPNGIKRLIKSKTLERDGWNTVEVVVRGDAAVHLVNGEINNYCVNMKAPQGESKELLPLTAGRIALQCECAELFYRNIELLPLDSK